MRIKNLALFITSSFLALSLAYLPISAKAALEKGTAAPSFSAKNQDGKIVSLSDFTGKAVLLYFYPKDDTPGCTKEACSFRDEFANFKAMGAVVLGVSRQDAKSHQEFRSKHKLPFDLLVDDKGLIAKAYDVGSIPLMGLTKRQSILLDKNGLVIKFYKDVDPNTHAAEVLKELAANQANTPQQ